MDAVAVKDNCVSFTNSDGSDIRASLIRFSRQGAFFEVHSPNSVLKASEVLSDFRIVCQHRAVNTGRAVIVDLVTAGTSAFGAPELEDPWDQIWAQEKPRCLENLTVSHQVFCRVAELWRGRAEFEVLVAPNGLASKSKRELA